MALLHWSRWGEVHVSCPMLNLPSLLEGSVTLWAHWAMTGVVGDRGWWTPTKQVILSSGLKFCTEAASEACLHRMKIIFILCSHSESSSYILRPQTSLSPIFQTYSFQIPDHTAKPSTISQESVGTPISSYLHFQEKQTTWCTVARSALWKLPCVAGLSWSGAVVLELPTSRQYQ